MPFTVSDFQDLMRLLEQQPEWRAQLRRQVLSDELLDLPAAMRDLAAAGARTEARLEELTAHVDALTARVDSLTIRMEELTARVDSLTIRMEELTAHVDSLTIRMEELTARVDTLTLRVEELTARVDALTLRVEELTARVDALTARMEELVEAQARTERAVTQLLVDVGVLKGHDLERRYRERPFDFFGRLIRRAHSFTQEELDIFLESPVADGRISEDEADDILLSDAVIRGRRRADGTEVFLVVEVSSNLDSNDVERATRRAGLLARAGVGALPVIAGPASTSEAEALARTQGVTWISNGALRPLNGLF